MIGIDLLFLTLSVRVSSQSLIALGANEILLALFDWHRLIIDFVYLHRSFNHRFLTFPRLSQTFLRLRAFQANHLH